MGRTVSFVVREDLANWLEEKAEERMKTISGTCEDLIIERYNEEQSNGNGNVSTSEDVLEKHSDKWYRPSSKNYEYAYRTESGNNYVKTKDALKSALKERFE